VFGDILGEELWRVRKACGWAAELGAEHLVIGAGAQRSEPATDADYDRLATGLDAVARIAEEHGLVASYHPHMSTIAESPEQIEKVFSRTPIRFCPDAGHLHLGGGDPAELVRRYRDRIEYVHIKDVDDEGMFVPLGTGVLDVPAVLAVLRETGFDGWMTVETDGWDGNPSEGARTSRAFLRDHL
jgi:inosose dehydratase